LAIVFDNIIFSLQQTGGVSRFWSKIIEPWFDREDCLFIERNDCEQNAYRRNLHIPRTISDHHAPHLIGRYLNFRRSFLPEPFLFHSSYYRVNHAAGCRNVTTVHDLIYEKFSSGLGTVLHKRQKMAALRASDWIVCISEHTKNDLFAYYPFCEEKHVSVIPNGVEGFKLVGFDEAFLASLGIYQPEAYFLYVGHRGRCKGFERVYDVLDELQGELKCIVVGAPFTPEEKVQIEERGQTGEFIHAGRVTDEQLNILYSNARFFFFPSLYEGFGIPPLEAMQAGCPVLASNSSSIPEVVGNAGVLFDSFSQDDLRAALIRVMETNISKQIRERGLRRAGEYTWKRVTNEYTNVYSKLLNF
jgi:mannosyltransferase